MAAKGNYLKIEVSEMLRYLVLSKSKYQHDKPWQKI
jgi:hypothetical protein